MNFAENASKSAETSSTSKVNDMEGLELTESAKLHAVTSIALNNVFIPGINREYVEPEMKDHYIHLKEHYHIDDIENFVTPEELLKYESEPPLNDNKYIFILIFANFVHFWTDFC